MITMISEYYEILVCHFLHEEHESPYLMSHDKASTALAWEVGTLPEEHAEFIASQRRADRKVQRDNR
jgi:hypothetical protein